MHYITVTVYLYFLTSCLSSWCWPPGVPTPLLEPTRPLPTLPPRRHQGSDRKHSPPALPGNGKPNICDGNFNTVAILRREMFVFKVRIWPQSKQGRKLGGDWMGGSSPGDGGQHWVVIHDRGAGAAANGWRANIEPLRITRVLARTTQNHQRTS